MTTLFWLSFCSASRPVGAQFLGACIVEGSDMLSAVKNAHTLGINPGGEVMGVDIEPETAHLVSPSWQNRLLTREECAAIEKEMEKRLDEAGLVFDGEDKETSLLCEDHNPRNVS